MKSFIVTLLASTLFGTASLSAQETPPAALTDTVQQKIAEISGNDATVLKFAKASSSLSASDKAALKAMLDAAKETGPIKEVLVLAYADSDYPLHQKGDLPKASRNLAEARGDKVKKNLEGIGASDVKVFNMAKKTNWFDKSMVTKDAQVKAEAAERPAEANSDDRFYQTLGQHLNTQGGSGKVVIVVRREGLYGS